MIDRRLWADRLLEHPLDRRLVALPFVLIAVIGALCFLVPTYAHLAPLLIIAPALAASFAGPRLTAVTGVLAVVVMVLIVLIHGWQDTINPMAQIIALIVLSALVVLYCVVRDRRHRALIRVRSVAETAQRVLLRPPPHRVGPLRVAWLYLTAEDETQIGGDLFAVTRAPHAGSRVVIGDVRGKGLNAIGEASVVLGAFREGAHRCATLPELVAALEDSVSRSIDEVADTEHDPGEHFITALVLDIPDHGPQAEMINCGHPPPLLVRGREVRVLHSHSPAPPLGVGEPAALSHRTDPFTLETGDALLLYTDGVIEARSPTGAFYPLAERVASFPASSPETLLRRIHDDLLDHTGKPPTDDAALLVVERAPSPRYLHAPHITARPRMGHRRRHAGGPAPLPGPADRNRRPRRSADG
ncbi:PP2C family protein-serine/threonine phosphatase [Streptomyces sp. AK02-01A]|uniref:PP2C family protein-serine/threonine phosphatase n=1 Tax=Streptomyces sp. AK02-01A TaxID=3028648 RepID=UPI0029BA1A87|nr:PP2C family protein-serine/threonine phosphatase [Streptomyces sp. AK02-01A]MDX3850430.1 PP2C family protein-serine/threonine phosphatase [Streptomyces sp. AK02-01A]